MTSGPLKRKYPKFMRQYAPSDIATMTSLPEVEQQYRRLRNEWLTIKSQLRQAEERYNQAVKSKDGAEIESSKVDLAKVQEKAGWYRRLCYLAMGRASGPVFMLIAERWLPRDVFVVLREATQDVLGRELYEMGMEGGRITDEHYEFFNEVLKTMGPKDTEESPF